MRLKIFTEKFVCCALLFYVHETCYTKEIFYVFYTFFPIEEFIFQFTGYARPHATYV